MHSATVTVAAGGGAVRASVRRARRLATVRDFGLVLPLVLLLLLAFAIPILSFMYRSVDNGLLNRSFPRTHAALQVWSAPNPVPAR